jgi:hypothetical protein
MDKSSVIPAGYTPTKYPIPDSRPSDVSSTREDSSVRPTKRMATPNESSTPPVSKRMRYNPIKSGSFSDHESEPFDSPTPLNLRTHVLETKVKRLEDRLNQSENRLDKCIAMDQARQQEVGDLKKQADKELLELTIESLQNENGSLKGRIQDLVKEKESLGARIKNKIQNLVGENETLRSERTAAANTIASRDKTIAELESYISGILDKIKGDADNLQLSETLATILKNSKCAECGHKPQLYK